MRTTNESKTECTEIIHKVFAHLLAAGFTEEVIVDAVIDQLYDDLFEPNIVEPMLEECRRVRNAAFGGTYEETACL